MNELERVVQVIHEGRIFTFRTDADSPLAFWCVELDGQVHPLAFRVMGDEGLEFFRALLHQLLARNQFGG